MNILWLSWKDNMHPQAGGAEMVKEQLAKRLVLDGHKVNLLVGGFNGGKHKQKVNGYQIIRVGGRYSVYWHAYKYYKHHLKNWPDLVIEEVNTIPFFTKYYVKQRRILFFHQLARQIWFYQMRFPLSYIGYLLEPVYLRMIRGGNVITVSNSTKKDLMRYGYKAKDIKIISEGIQLKPVKNLSDVKKFNNPTLLSLGAMRAMKRTIDQIDVFTKAKQQIPNLQLKIAGDSSGKYGKKVLRHIENSEYKNDIEYLGRVSSKAKLHLLHSSHLILVTSIKEGWGLIVTEAASQGTPAVVYNVDGLRDSVINNWSGNITQNHRPDKMAAKVVNLLKDKQRYNKFRKNAWTMSKQINFNVSFKQFNEVVQK